MFLLFSLVACAPTYDNFPAKLAAVVCERSKECALGSFESRYDDMAECMEEVAEVYESSLDRIDDDDFDARDAADCIAEIRSRDCEDVVNDGMPSECQQALYDSYYDYY
jgi:hypothetical protein